MRKTMELQQLAIEAMLMTMITIHKDTIQLLRRTTQLLSLTSQLQKKVLLYLFSY